MVLTLYHIYFFCFQMCNHLLEVMKNGDAGIFPLYYSFKVVGKSFRTSPEMVVTFRFIL